MIIRTNPSGKSPLENAETWYCWLLDSIERNAATADLNGPSIAPPPRTIIPLGRPPAARMPGTPDGSSSGIGIACEVRVQRVTAKQVSTSSANSNASASPRGYSTSTVPFGLVSSTPIKVSRSNKRLLGERFNLSSTSALSASAWRLRASATSICNSAVSFSAWAAAPNASEPRSLASAICFLDSISSRFADLAIKIPRATSPNTPMVTSPSPVSERGSGVPCFSNAIISGPDSVARPTTTRDPKRMEIVSNQPNHRLTFNSLLLGPFIRRKGRNGQSGPLPTAIWVGLFICILLFLFVRGGSP